MIPQFSVIPSRQNPTTFAADMDQLLSELPGFVSAANSLEQSLQLVATTGTSTTSNAVGTGSRTFTTQAGKAWVVGSFVYVVSSASVSNMMIGQVTAYNTGTGALTINVVTASGSGTIASWVIGLSAPLGSSASFSGTVTASVFQVDAQFTLGLASGSPVIYLDAGDYILYDRANNTMNFGIAGQTRQFFIDASQGPASNGDASTANGLVRKSQMDASVASVAIGGFRGLALSANGTSSNVSVSADALVLLDGSGLAKLVAPSLTISAAASGTNGLDTGTLAASTWYSVWVISNGTTVAGLLSLSATAPTMPNGYTYKARVGWIRTDSTGNKYPLAFKQYGRRVQYVIAAGSNLLLYPYISSGVQGSFTTPTWVACSTSSFVPSTASAIAISANCSPSSGTTYAVNPNAGITGPLNNGANRPAVLAASSNTYSFGLSAFGWIGLESSNIYVISDNANNNCSVIGWEDNL